MVNLPFAGHTNPTLPLTEALIKHGHEVLYINSEEFRQAIEKTGAQFVPYQNYPAQPTEQEKKTASFRAAFDTAMNLEQKCDLLIYEMFFYPGLKLSEKLGIQSVRQFSQPAWSQKTMDEASLSFKISCQLIDMQVMGKGNKKHMGLSHTSMRDSILNNKPALNIVYVSEKFQQDRESFGQDFIFTIPEHSKSHHPPLLDYEKLEHPLVYISLGSIISNKEFCKECIRAFGNKELSVILNTGRILPSELGRIPENIFANSFVPQTQILEHAEVFLTHCGMNSVNESLTYGVPMVAMPFINDQVSNAKRIVELGVGKRVRSFPSSGRQLYRTVVDVLNNKEMRSRSAEIQETLKHETSIEEVVGFIEEQLIR